MTPYSPISPDIDDLWEHRGALTRADRDARAVVVAAVDLLDSGDARVAVVDEQSDEVVVDERARRAILLSFQVMEMTEGTAGFRRRGWIPLKERLDGVRIVPGAIAVWGSYLAPGVMLLPSFVSIGSYVGSRSLVDTWATVGSGAQVGRDVHVAGGVGIGGIVEPPSAFPVVIEDDVFIGSRSVIVEGARVRRGAKLGAGVILTRSTHVFDAETGDELPRGEAPAWSVCVSSTKMKKFPGGEFGMPCLLVLRHLPEGSIHDKSALNEIIRDYGVAR
ncbi:2,3,4,5-tetrahydropyridine-2,6-dicarboxylate N-succinyltransferase [Streptomyces wuyuanensis]|uniref:2,3,4,5-tetrahydropyridine-2,6-dicarboxylate N-succinyltransferase n=1 Tax=Streptomyces wuyuanensis TaxID=1196353 RepID=UPI003437C6AF